ncbi:uncharacterized protein LOC128960161 [Oppia nitens]|uniref:uncharacterized protein LOC128960161 n=1 Tax=Oppia nitens TaxID=1686743 RepID=UPI0023DBFF24|nr:uncharacterized protein LOC128960161 [Oppia nitens]
MCKNMTGQFCSDNFYGNLYGKCENKALYSCTKPNTEAKLIDKCWNCHEYNPGMGYCGPGCKCGQWLGNICGSRVNQTDTEDNEVFLLGECEPNTVYQCSVIDANPLFNTSCHICNETESGNDECYSQSLDCMCQDNVIGFYCSKNNYKKLYGNCDRNALYFCEKPKSRAIKISHCSNCVDNEPGHATCGHQALICKEYADENFVWPSVQTGQYSEIKCPNGPGYIRLKCMDDGTFDSIGPLYENCWIDHLINYKLTDIDHIDFVLDKIENYTSTSTGLQSIDDQTGAWIHSDNESQIVTIASKLLAYIETSAFTTSAYLNSQNKSQTIISNNINKYTIVGYYITGLTKYLFSNKSNIEVNSDIIGLSIENNDKQNLNLEYTSKISLTHIKKLNLGDKVDCANWDFNSNDWSFKNCHLIDWQSDRETTVCECLTSENIALLLDKTDRESHNLAKSILTYIALISTMLCCLYVIGYVFVKTYGIDPQFKSLDKLLKRYIKKMHFSITNYSLCLLIANILVLITLNTNTTPIFCEIQTALLALVLLSQFFWFIWQSFYALKISYDNDFVINKKQSILFAYGLPICLIAIYILCNRFIRQNSNYLIMGSDYFCYISSDKFYNNMYFIIGLSAVIIIFDIILLKMSSVNFGHKLYSTLLQLNNFICWTLFSLYVNRSSSNPVILYYLFIMINAIQGPLMLCYIRKTVKIDSRGIYNLADCHQQQQQQLKQQQQHRHVINNHSMDEISIIGFNITDNTKPKCSNC